MIASPSWPIIADEAPPLLRSRPFSNGVALFYEAKTLRNSFGLARLFIDGRPKPGWARRLLRTSLVALVLYSVWISATMSIKVFVDIGPHVT